MWPQRDHLSTSRPDSGLTADRMSVTEETAQREPDKGRVMELSHSFREKSQTSVMGDPTLSLSSVCSLTGDRPTFKNIHHVEEGQRQGGLPAARAAADPHLQGEERRPVSWAVTPPRHIRHLCDKSVAAPC